MESRAEALAGEIQTTSRRLASLKSVRLTGDNGAGQSSRMVLEERQLESELANLRSQQEVLRHQQAALTITSPIAGTIVGWQLQRRLADRPVSRGNLLVSVVDHSGPWALQLDLPDQDAGPVLESIRARGQPARDLRGCHRARVFLRRTADGPRDRGATERVGAARD